MIFQSTDRCPFVGSLCNRTLCQLTPNNAAAKEEFFNRYERELERIKEHYPDALAIKSVFRKKRVDVQYRKLDEK